MKRKSAGWALTCGVLMVGVVLSAGGSVFADPILAGFDFFQTPSADLDLFGGGGIGLQGKPIDSIGLGDTDTIVERKAGLGAGMTGPIPIELVALSLQSVNPVNVGGNFFDVFVTVNQPGLPGVPQPDLLPPSLGQYHVTTHNDTAGGGTFDSFFDIFVDVTLTNPGGDPNLPLDVVNHFPLGPFHVTSTGDGWSHTPPPGYPTDPDFPSGGFFPGGPLSGERPIIPEPATFILMSPGLAALLLLRKFT